MHSCIRAFPLALTAAALVILVPASSRAQVFESIGIRAQGMSGAFVAVSDDATATWWNPAGLAAGGFFSTILEFDRSEDPAATRARAFAMMVPSLGFSYYRLSLSGMQLSYPTASEAFDRENEGALNRFGATVGQSIGSHVVIASTLKLVNALGETRGDLDAGMLAMFDRVRLGLAVRNLRTPDFSDGERRLDLPRQVRTGVSLTVGSASRAEVVVAADADLTTTPTRFGDARHAAVGVETRLANGTLGLRAGIGTNTVGRPRTSGSVGASVAVWSGLFVDGQVTRGDDQVRNGWGFAIRLAY